MTRPSGAQTAEVDPGQPGQRLELECETCGFRGSTLGPKDAIVAIRSLPRRYRAGFGIVSDEAEDLLLRRPGRGWWSALELAGHVRDMLHSKEKRLRRVNLEREPLIGEELEIPPSGVSEQGAEAILSALQYNAEQLARAAESMGGKDWLRTGQRRGGAVTALDLLREAVHEGTHHLRDLDRALRRVRLIDLRGGLQGGGGGVPTDQ